MKYNIEIEKKIEQNIKKLQEKDFFLNKAINIFNSICKEEIKKNDLHIKLNNNDMIKSIGLYVDYHYLRIICNDTYEEIKNEIYIHETDNLSEIALIKTLSKFFNSEYIEYTVKSNKEGIEHKHYVLFKNNLLEVKLHTSYIDDD